MPDKTRRKLLKYFGAKSVLCVITQHECEALTVQVAKGTPWTFQSHFAVSVEAPRLQQLLSYHYPISAVAGPPLPFRNGAAVSLDHKNCSWDRESNAQTNLSPLPRISNSHPTVIAVLVKT